MRHLASWDQSRAIEPWLLGIAANRCRTALGRRNRQPVNSDGLPEPSVNGHTASDGIGEEVQRAVDGLRMITASVSRCSTCNSCRCRRSLI